MNVLHIALREVRSSFTTVVGWLVLDGWLFLTAVFWNLMVANYVETGRNLTYDPYQASQLNLTLVLALA